MKFLEAQRESCNTGNITAVVGLLRDESGDYKLGFGASEENHSMLSRGYVLIERASSNIGLTSPLS